MHWLGVEDVLVDPDFGFHLFQENHLGSGFEKVELFYQGDKTSEYFQDQLLFAAQLSLVGFCEKVGFILRGL